MCEFCRLQPLPLSEHNGVGFHYKVGYRLLRDGGSMSYATVSDPNAKELVIYDQTDTFQQYEILVQSVNSLGEAPILENQRKLGYSGEGSKCKQFTAAIH